MMSTRLRALLPLLCLLAVLVFSAPPSALAQTYVITVTGVNQRTNVVSVRAIHSAAPVCTEEGTWSFDWGDGESTNFTSNHSSTRTHTYQDPGQYTITLTYDCTQFGDPKTATVTRTISALSPSWGSGTPQYEAVQGVVFFEVESNKDNTTVVCSIPATGASVNCLIGVLTSAPAPTICGTYGVQAVATRGSETVTLRGSVTVTHTETGPCPTPVQRSEDDSSESDSSQPQRRVEPTRDPARLPIPTQDHSRLPAGAAVDSDSPWIHFNEIEVGRLGQQWVIDAGARAAIDVWSPLPLDAEICFAGVGSLLLLDAAYSPRLRAPLESYLRGSQTCAQLDRAGTVVLMPGEPTHAISPTATPQALAASLPTATWNPNLIADSLDQMVSLENCQVGSLYTLNLRERPAGPVMRWFNGLANALARTPNWFQIVHNGELGWISAHYVTASGDCA